MKQDLIALMNILNIKTYSFTRDTYNDGLNIIIQGSTVDDTIHIQNMGSEFTVMEHTGIFNTNEAVSNFLNIKLVGSVDYPKLNI